MSFLLKNYSFVKSVYLFIRCSNTRLFLQNTNNTDRNGVNKQNTHTHTHTHTHTKHFDKDNIGKRGVQL